VYFSSGLEKYKGKRNVGRHHRVIRGPEEDQWRRPLPTGELGSPRMDLGDPLTLYGHTVVTIDIANLDFCLD
jgi:hypothetical protein